MLNGTVLKATVVDPVFYDRKEHVSMADASNGKPVFSGQTALAGKLASKRANPAGGTVGLVFREMKHLGKLNIRGNDSLQTALKAATGCKPSLQTV